MTMIRLYIVKSTKNSLSSDSSYGLFEAVVDTHCVQYEWASSTRNQMKMTYLIPVACSAFQPEPGGEMGGWTEQTTGRREEARQSRSEAGKEGRSEAERTKEEGNEGGGEARLRKEERVGPASELKTILY